MNILTTTPSPTPAVLPVVDITLAERVHKHLGSILTSLKIYGISGDASFAFDYTETPAAILSDPNFEKLAAFCARKGKICRILERNAHYPTLIRIEDAVSLAERKIA